jgi:hypothetical protein
VPEPNSPDPQFAYRRTGRNECHSICRPSPACTRLAAPSSSFIDGPPGLGSRSNSFQDRVLSSARPTNAFLPSAWRRW